MVYLNARLRSLTGRHNSLGQTSRWLLHLAPNANNKSLAIAANSYICVRALAVTADLSVWRIPWCGQQKCARGGQKSLDLVFWSLRIYGRNDKPLRCVMCAVVVSWSSDKQCGTNFVCGWHRGKLELAKKCMYTIWSHWYNYIALGDDIKLCILNKF